MFAVHAATMCVARPRSMLAEWAGAAVLSAWSFVVALLSALGLDAASDGAASGQSITSVVCVAVLMWLRNRATSAVAGSPGGALATVADSSVRVESRLSRKHRGRGRSRSGVNERTESRSSSQYAREAEGAATSRLPVPEALRTIVKLICEGP